MKCAELCFEKYVVEELLGNYPLIKSHVAQFRSYVPPYRVEFVLDDERIVSVEFRQFG